MSSDFSEQTIEESIFTAHHNYYQSVGIETIKQQAGQVEQVSSDYQGRVIYELLQNAFDKAESKILVLVKDSCLYIANDGQQFSYRSNYDYRGNSTTKRSDFQSLCSISTSTKNANDSIGNKGVGFKSVFAIAANGYADVHTKGIIQDDEATIISQTSFRIYDSFKSESDLPIDLPSKVKTFLSKQILQVQTERKERGVPGYYYPVLLKSKDEFINELFNLGFVTVIQIPFANNISNEIQDLFKEIKNIHFEFIQIRIQKNIKVNFEYEGNTELCFENHIGSTINSNQILQCPLNENIRYLAREANINITNPQIALRFKELDKGEHTIGLLYNYLPTKIESPFKYVDFHADFHTTVDRKSINFDGKIGAYNKALLRACLELYFTYLNSCSQEQDKGGLRILNLSSKEVNFNLRSGFNWKYLRLQNPWISFELVRDILQIWNNREHDYSYKVACQFISALAKSYFEKGRSIESHDQFFKRTNDFINYFSRDDNQAQKWKDYFRINLADELKKNGAKIIFTGTEIGLPISNEIIYREQKEEDEINAFVPDFLGINLVNYKVEDNDFRRALGIKEFKDRNEVLKHYRQVSPVGKYHAPEKCLTESQQQDLLRSISTLMGKTDESVTSTHRYKNYINRSGSENSIANLADFSVSTVFLKTNAGKFKPAQLCSILELDLSFLPSLPTGIKQETFLKYLGVSYLNNYRFVENTIWRVLNDGIDYIPALWQGSQDQDDQLRHSRVLDGIRIIANGKAIHPALVNDNNYNFLEKLRVSEFKEESKQLLVKKYDIFPKEYISQLFEVCNKNLHNKEQLLRIYQNLFLPFNKFLKEYLVVQNGKLKFIKDTDFYIVNNEHEFHLVEDLLFIEKPILCYYKSSLEPKNYNFKGELLKLDEQEIEFSASSDKTELIKRDLLPKIFYVLLEISNSKLSEVDYFEEPDKITELSKKVANFRYLEVDNLQRKIKIGSFESKTVNRLYDFNETELYIQKDAAESIKVEALSKYLFNNIRISRALELILNHKEVNTLKGEYKKQRIVYEQIFNRYWVADYDIKFTALSKLILEQFNGVQYLSDKLWFEYSKTHKSEFILNVYNAGDLEKLISVVNTEKEQFESGIFSDFQLSIDLEMHDEQLARIGIILNCIENIDRVDDFKSRLDALAGKFGIEADLEALEQDMKSEFPDAFSSSITQDQIESKAREISIKSKVERIYQNIIKTPAKATSEFESSTNSVASSIPVKTKKVMFQGSTLPSSQTEMIGASGEEEVLYFLIQHFLEIKDTTKRKEALVKVHALILSLLRNTQSNITKHTELFNSCLSVIDNDAELTKSLIPFYYVTLHYKFAFIDLVAWYDNKAVMVEVKTTLNHRNNSFRISNSEINEARANQNYMIVRVTPHEMILMGNPIYNIKEKLMKIEGGNYVIQPHGYTFEFIKLPSNIEAK
ncbi:sacsin N-terminal ATP-binding-like domain-containing protein [Pontibacter sp. MBLB2868]|uniref:sacsin N-terminal ATP-binding-like domain-containing protein n=1 Tax=Pontibacter sp. MBLB2868 TaxID=3451555 RepID=UPI003F752194